LRSKNAWKSGHPTSAPFRGKSMEIISNKNLLQTQTYPLVN
jgi:hypothetical protein